MVTVKVSKFVNLKLLKRLYIDCCKCKYQVSFVQKSYFIRFGLGSCLEALTLIGIMKLYSEGNKTRVLMEI